MHFSGDQTHNAVYIGFQKPTGAARDEGPQSEIRLLVSHDGATTFHQPEALADGVLGYGYFAHVRANHVGDVVVAWARTENGPYNANKDPGVIHSLDGFASDPGATMDFVVEHPGGNQPNVCLNSTDVQAFWIEDKPCHPADLQCNEEAELLFTRSGTL